MSLVLIYAFWGNFEFRRNGMSHHAKEWLGSAKLKPYSYILKVQKFFMLLFFRFDSQKNKNSTVHSQKNVLKKIVQNFLKDKIPQQFPIYLKYENNLIGKPYVMSFVVGLMNGFTFAQSSWVNPFGGVVERTGYVLAHRSENCLHAGWYRGYKKVFFFYLLRKFIKSCNFQWISDKKCANFTYQSILQWENKSLGTQAVYRPKLTIFVHLNSQELYRPSYHKSFEFGDSIRYLYLQLTI